MATDASATRESVRDDVEAARQEYLTLLDSLSDQDWRRATGNAGWTAGQLMWHMAAALSLVPRGVRGLKKDRGFNPPGFLLHPLNNWIAKIGARKATRESVREKYEAAHRAALAAVEEVQEGEWGRGAKVFGEQRTVESSFRLMRAHVAEHVAEVRNGPPGPG